MFHLAEPMRKKLCPKTNAWFEKIMNSTEARKAYGRIVLCTTPLKPFDGKVNKKDKENKNQEEKVNKMTKKKKIIKKMTKRIKIIKKIKKKTQKSPNQNLKKKLKSLMFLVYQNLIDSI